MTDDVPGWISAGRGIAPTLRWSFSTDAPLSGLQLAREAGTVMIADAAGGLYCLDRHGQARTLSRGLGAVRKLAWSDTGRAGAAVVGDSTLCRLDDTLQVQWSLDFAEPILTVAIDAYGNYLAVSLANGTTLVFDAHHNKLSQFETLRPLSHVAFLVSRTALVGVADHGLVCCHHLNGKPLWSERLWANVGDVSVTGDGSTILLAEFNRGIQAFDGRGGRRGSYLVEGTVSRVSTSFNADHIVTATLERHLYWLDSDGKMLWATEAADDVHAVLCDPLGEWFLCGLETGRVLRLDWESAA